MQEVSQEYKTTIARPFLAKPYEIDCMLEVINQEAQEQASLQYDSLEYYVTKQEQVFLNVFPEAAYATCEENFSRVDGSFLFLPKKDKEPYMYQGAVGSILTDKDQKIEQLFHINFMNELTYEIKGICLHFQYAYPDEFVIEDKDGTELYRYQNDQFIFKTNDVFTFHKGMRLRILKMNKPHHRCRIAYIEFGMYVQLSNEQVISMEYRQQIHPLSNDCYISDMNITCINQNGEYDTENPSSVINFLEKLQDVKISLALPLSKGKEVLPLAKLYLNEWSSNKKEVTFKAIDIFAFLDSSFYQIGNATEKNAYELCVEILRDAKISEYEISTSLHGVMIENPIPKGSHKDCLKLLCNAVHCIFYQDRYGKVVITPSSYAQKSGELTKEDMLEIATGTKLEQVKQLEIMYTKFHQSTELEQVNKATYEKGEVFLEFSNPVVQLQVVSGQANIILSGPYFVKLEVIEDGEIILNGYKLQESKQRCVYTLNERGVVKTIDNTLISSKQMAQSHWDWMKPFVESDRRFDASIKGRMEIDVLDILGLENDFNKNLQIQVEDLALSFSGTLQGNLKGRKVIR